jgi:hypothetical protein
MNPLDFHAAKIAILFIFATESYRKNANLRIPHHDTFLTG